MPSNKDANISAVERRGDGTPRESTQGPSADPAMVEAVRVLVLQGMRAVAIARTIAPQFKVSERTVSDYIKRVREEHREQRKDVVEEDLERAIDRFTFLGEQAMKCGDLKEARENEVQVCKLLGLYAPKKVEHSGAVTTGVLLIPPRPVKVDPEK